MLWQARRSVVERQACSGGPRTPWEVARLGQVRGHRRDDAFRRAFGEVPIRGDESTKTFGEGLDDAGATIVDAIWAAGRRPRVQERFSKLGGDADVPDPDDTDIPWSPRDGRPAPLPEGALDALPRFEIDPDRPGAGRQPCAHSYAADVFAPPPSADWGSACRTPEQVAACGVLAPRVKAWSCLDLECDFTVADYVDIHDNCDGSLRKVIRAGWCLLLHNTDILQWVGCVALGSDMRRYSSGLFGVPFKVEVKCYDNPHTGTCVENPCAGSCRRDGAYSTLSFWSVGGGWMHVCSTATFWEFVVRLYEEGMELLAAVLTAGTLGHELMHVAWPVLEGDRADSDGCVGTNLFHNTLVWALFQRYLQALNRPCALTFRVDASTPKADLFLNKFLFQYDTDC